MRQKMKEKDYNQLLHKLKQMAEKTQFRNRLRPIACSLGITGAVILSIILYFFLTFSIGIIAILAFVFFLLAFAIGELLWMFEKNKIK